MHKIKKIINIIAKRLLLWKCESCDTWNGGRYGFCRKCKRQRGFVFWR